MKRCGLTATRRCLAVKSEETLGWLLELMRAWRGPEVRLRRTSRRLCRMWRRCRGSARRRVRGSAPLVTRDQICQVAINRTEKGPPRRLVLGYLNGNARLGLPRPHKTPHGLNTETSAQLPLGRVITHRHL